MKYIVKTVVSVFVICILALLNKIMIHISVNKVAQIGADQFNNSNNDYVYTQIMSDILKTGFGLTFFILCIILLCLVWYKDIKNLFDSAGSKNILLLGGIMALMSGMYSTNSHAYYSKLDWAEVYNVLPNHSAFIIPATGANKDNQ